MKELFKLGALLAVFCLFCTGTVKAQTNYTWTPTGSGPFNWGDTGNWSGGTVADGADNTATFSSSLTAAQVINLEADRTIGNITNSTGGNYTRTISGTNTLTLDRTSGIPTIGVVGSRTLTNSCSIAGNDGLQKTGAGTLTLAGSNSFSGGVFINGGTLTISSGTNLGDSGNLVTFTGDGTLSFAANTTLSQSFAINTNVTGTLAGYDKTVTINNSLAGSGTLFAAGAGTGGGYFIFTSTNNPFSGNIKIYSGSSGSYPAGLTMVSLADTPGSRITLGNNNSTVFFNYGADAVAPLELNNRQIEFYANWEYASSLNNNATNVNCTVTVNTDLLVSRNSTITFGLGGSNTGNNTFAGAITNKSGYVTSLTKSGNGKWILSGTNTYSGTTAISAGTLILSGINIGSGSTTLSAGKLQGVVGGSCSNSAVTVSGGTFGVSVTNNTMQWTCKSLTHSAASTLEFAFGDTVPGTNVAPLQVNGDVTFAIAPTVSCTGDGLTGLATGAYPLVKWTGTFVGVAPSTVTLSSGAGILVLDNANKTLWLSITASGVSKQPLTWKGPAGSEWIVNEAVYTKWQDATPVNTNYQETTVSGLTVGDNVVFSNAPGGVVTVNTNVFPASMLVAGTSNYTFSGTGSISGSGGLTKSGTGTLTLSATNSYSGGTFLSAGTLSIAANNALGTGSVVLGGGTIRSSDATAHTLNNPVILSGSTTVGGTGNLTFNGSGAGVVAAASTITVTNSNVNATFDTSFSGSYTLTKAGVGTMTLMGTNTYTGALIVNAGSMVITNGGKLFSGGAVSLGTTGGNTTTTKVVGGIGVTSLWDIGNQTLSVGNTTGANSLMIDGAGVAGSAVVTNVGTLQQGRSSHNSSIILTNGARMFVNGQVQMGSPYYDTYGVPQNNSITIMGGAANSIFCGSSNGFYVGYDDRPGVVANSVIVGAGGVMTNVGYNSGNRNIDFVLGKNSPYGAGSTQTSYSNQLVVTDGGQAFLLGNLSVGYIDGSAVVSSSNTLLIANGGFVNVPGALNVGWANAASATGIVNSVTVTNGGQFNTGAASYIGRAANATASTANNNTVSVGGDYNGTNALWNLGGANLYIGYAVSGATATGNVLTVSAGGVATNINALVVSSDAASGNSVVLSAGGRLHATSATITNNNSLTIGVDDAVTPSCGYLAVSGNLNINNSTINIVTNGSATNIVYVIASYGTLTGSFGTTNGLPDGWVFATNYQGNKIALVQPMPLPPAVVNSGPTNEGPGVCTLQGMLTTSGVANAWICWGTDDAGTVSTGNWQNVVSMGQVLQSNAFSTVASGLATNATYWYRCFASNSYGTAWSDPATWFNATPASGGGGGGTVVGSWTPSNLTCAAWYDAADTNTVLTSGSAVTNWLDKSGNGLNLSQGTASNQPTTGSIINSLNAIDFTGDKMATASNPFGAIISNAFVIAVHKVDSIANGDLFSLTGSDNAANRWQSHAPWGDGNLYFDCGGSAPPNRTNISYGVSAGNVVLASFYCSTADNVQQVYKNGSFLVGDSSGHAVSTVGNIMVGGGVNNYQDTTLGEFIIINGTVSVATRQRVEGYLAWKWGLQASLPADHPFRNGPPSANGGVVTYTDYSGLNPTNTPYAGGYVVHTFYGGSDTFSNSTAISADLLVVGGGGGGGGGYQGGGGGAGGLLYISTNLSAATYTIMVGAGGKGCRNGDTTAAANGASSSISNGAAAVVSTAGGGRGASENPNAAPVVGGSGGGGGHTGGLTGANGTSGQGSKGGDGANPDSNPWPCGGGGGAGAAGGNGSGSTPGTGGAGTNLSISGSAVTYAAGGKGGWRTTTYTGTNGVANTGNGGEGGGSTGGTGTGGNGGSGIVIVRYPYSSSSASIANLAPTAITNNSAVLNAMLSCPTTSCDVWVHWGTSDQTTNFSWASSAYVGSWTNVVSTNVCYTNSSFAPESRYYYTFRATNATDNVWASPSWQFTTISGGGGSIFMFW